MKHKHHKMKAETRYITFNGASFSYKEDAEYYEKIVIAKTRRNQCEKICTEMMHRVHITRTRIKRLEEMLANLNQIIRHPELHSEPDIINARAKRFDLRWEINIERNLHITNKRTLHKYQRMYSEINKTINILRKQWEEIKNRRYEKL